MEIKDLHAKESSFSRALLAGLICGIIAAALIAFYNFEYRKLTGFKGFNFVEPLLIFIALPLLLVLTAFVFLGMVEVWKRGELYFVILALLITAGAVVFILLFRGASLSGGNGLLLGMGVITGLVISFLLPFLATHPKIFMEKEELAESAQ